MNQKIPPSKKPENKGVINSQEKGKGPVVGSTKNISDVERFNRFMTMDLRLPSSYTHVDLETFNAYSKLRHRATLLGNALSFSKDSLRKEQKKFGLSPSFAFLLSLPIFAFYVSQELKPPYQYCLPKSMPGLGMVLKKASLIDWSSVVGTQYFYQIDWKDVGISHYTPDSAFVLFSPKARFKNQQQYAAFFETFQEIDAPTSSKTIDLVPTTKNTYGLATQIGQVLTQANLVKRITRYIGKPRATKLRQQRLLEKHLVTKSAASNEKGSFLSSGLSFSMLNNVAKLRTNEVKLSNFFPNDPKYINSSEIISQKSNSNNSLLNSKETDSHVTIRFRGSLKQKFFKGALRHKSAFTLPTKNKHIPISSADPWSLSQKHILEHNSKTYMPIGHLLSSRDQHVLYSPDEIDQIHQKFQDRLNIQNEKPIAIKKIASQHYWQPFFNAFDLIPTKMESMTFSNKPNGDLFSDLKAMADNLNFINKGNLLATLQKQRDERRKEYKVFDRNEKFGQPPISGVSPYTNHFDFLIDKLKVPDKNNLIGTKMNTVSRQKHYLVSETHHSVFNDYQKNSAPMDDLLAADQTQRMFHQNKKDLLKNKWNTEDWNENSSQQIPPLFNAKQQERQ